MLRRPLHLFTLGLLAMATSSPLHVAAKDKEARSQNRSSSSAKSNASPSSSTGTSTQSSSKPANSTSPSNASNSSTLRSRIDAFRAQQSQSAPTQGGSAQPRNVQQPVPNKTAKPSFINNGTAQPATQGVDLNKLRSRMEQSRSQSTPSNPSGSSASGSSPARGLPSNFDRSAVQQRLEEFRRQVPANSGQSGAKQTPSGAGGSTGNQNAIGGTPGFEKFRERLSNPTTGNATQGTTPEAERLRERFRESLNAGSSGSGAIPSRGGSSKTGETVQTPNLQDLKNRIETRKPQLDSSNSSAVEALRERMRGQLPADKKNSLPKLPGTSGDTQNGNRIELGTRRPDLGKLKIDPGRFDGSKPGRGELANQFRDVERIRDVDQLRKGLDRFQNNPEVRDVLRNTPLKVTDLSGAFQSRVGQRGNFDNIIQTPAGRKYDLDRQFNLFGRGDVTRQLNLNQTLLINGGWSKRVMGPVYSQYTTAHFSAWYPGPSWYPRYCWTPHWSPWVRWSFWDFCRPIYDPRPFLCRPIYYYDPCPPIVYYQTPIWQPLPIVTCGTWVDVPLSVTPAGYDLQLLAVRFVDPGHPEENLGPRYRVWVRNNSTIPVQSPFNVMLVASNDAQLYQGLPEAGVTVDGMEPGAVVPVDIRLPSDANRMNIAPNGQRTPFAMLHVLVDSHRELAELDETNNGTALDRGEILPVDPAAFATEEPSTFPGSMVSLAGEGFGPEPGQLIVISGNREFPAEIHGWYDLGVHFKMPNLPVTGANTAQILVIRGDGAASNPVTVALSGN